MPRIINAYADNSSLANSLKDLGEAMFGDQAKNEVYRQTAFGKKRENDNIPLLADAVASGDRNALARYGVLSGKTGQDTADFNRLGVSNHASSVDDPRMALATMGAGGAFTSTAPGQGRALANDRTIAGGHDATSLTLGDRRNATSLEDRRLQNENNITTTGMNNGTSISVGEGNNNASRDVAHIQADKQAQSDKYKFDNTYENTYDPNTGRTVLTPRSQASGREVAPTKDSVVGGMLRKVADNQQSGAPATNPFATLSPQMQHVAGVAVPQQSLVHPGSGMTGISRDGGETVILPNGATIPATGFQPVDQGTALAEARGGIQRAQTAQPLVVGNPATSQAAADAAQTSGIGAKVQKVANEELGALPLGPSIIKAVTGSPQIAPATQQAQQTQDIRNNQARSVLLGAPGRQTVQAQQWVNELLPQGSALANPATESAKIPIIVNALKGDHEQYRQIVQTTADPAERTKALLAMHQIENTIRMYTEQAAGAPQAAAPQAAAPAAAQPVAAQPAAGGDPLAQARAAIAQGADPAAVKQRLQQNGINPAGL